MTIVTSLDHKPTLEERQVFTVMRMLEDAITSNDDIDTHALAEQIVGEVYELEAHADATSAT